MTQVGRVEILDDTIEAANRGADRLAKLKPEEISVERLGAPAKLAIEDANVIQAATAEPLFRGWWRVTSRSYVCEVRAFVRADLAAAVEAHLADVGVLRVYGPRSVVTSTAHASLL